MPLKIVFSWAKNAEGKMVHIDDVPRGIDCGCFCPNCNEMLVARHGDVNKHGFAHHSKRGANLNICYMVTMYKLAEHIIQNKKRIHAPSYYGIFKEIDIEFIDVKIDDQYKREDKQPDVIAIAKNGEQYLIEFVFEYKAQHKRKLDYRNLSCIEINLSNQSLETLETFLLSSSEDRKWLNNENYFNQIEEKYKKANKRVKVVSEVECNQCKLKQNCCEVRQGYIPLIIENSGKTYRLCKIEQYEEKLDRIKKMEFERQKRLEEQNVKDGSEIQKCSEEKSCFNCINNISWDNKDGFASCGIHFNLGITKNNYPSYAMSCRGFKHK